MDLLLTSLAYPLSLTKNTKINLITSEDMNIKVNNEALDFKGKTVADLIAQLGLPAVGVAVAIGTDIVSRDAWQTKELAEGDYVMIIRAASGG